MNTEPYEVRQDLQDSFLYSGKHQPQLYLNAKVRSGISTFALLADPAEVEQGCQRLASDIQTGRINQVIETYRHSGGDYLFVISQKNAT